MKASRIVKSVSFLLLIFLTLQFTDITCFDEGLSPAAGQQGEHLLKAASPDSGNNTYSPSAILNQCQCPCHLSFSQVPSLTLAAYLSAGLPTIFTASPSIPKISTDFFQPPKILI